MSTKKNSASAFEKAVERKLKKATRRFMEGALLDGCLRLWRDFAREVDLSRDRKPEAWSAAVLYAFERMQYGGLTQEEAADMFGVSAITVSQKYRQLAATLDLRVLDARYLEPARRAALRRQGLRLPDDLPLLEAPTDLWILPSWGDEVSYQAQEWVYDGWEALAEGQVHRAERHFEKALGRDPTLVDAHNGLANVAEVRGDLSAAEEHYREAYEQAREALGSEAPQAYHWWGELETRPYMRARQGLGWIYWQTERYRAALEEYEALLRLNPNDNQGVRYVIAPLYQFAGDLEGALKAYQRYARDYPDDRGDPHHTFCWGLALYEAGRHGEALQRWHSAFFENIYLAPLLLEEEPPEDDLWHFTNLEWLDYAEDYVQTYGALWRDAPEAKAALRALWHDPDVQREIHRWLEVRAAMKKQVQVLRSGDDPGARAAWAELLEQARAIEEASLGEVVQRRVLDASG